MMFEATKRIIAERDEKIKRLRAQVERLRAVVQCIATDERVESITMARTIARAEIERGAK
jgi:tetrahydromethanopterin S-methyltransferase subunit F